MSRLSISLLGSPQVAIDGVPVKIPAFRAIPLLAYLAVTETSQRRETLANLLWTDDSLSNGLASLRTTLWRLKSTGLEEWLVLDRNEISLNHQKPIEVDTLEFRSKINQCSTHGHPSTQICLFCIPALTEAVGLFHGEFLPGFNLSKAQAFDDWRLQESEALHVLFLDALERLVRGHRTFGEFTQAIQYARLLLTYDRYNENAQFDLLQLYTITGQRAAAIIQYKHYKDFLSHELGLDPSDEMTSLYKQILTGRAASHTTQSEKSPVFMTADIEKAALLWAQAGAKKSEYISTYQSIFIETSRRFGGHILQKSEDSITMLFENGQPLDFAVTIHLKIKKADWGDLDPPNIRMVLYSTSMEDGSYNNFAMLTRTASNLLAISWGGQIIFTERTLKDLDIPPGSRIKDLGFHSLKEIEAPVHVYELQHPHLPVIDHPPLQSVSLHSINFPSAASGFIGRETELAKLTEMIQSPDCRIISLVGPGGVGKTSLAVQFALKIGELFPDGIYLISLASIQDPNLIPIVLADALKFSFYGPTDHIDQLANYLHHLKALLVFDNFEHLRMEGAKFLAFLLGKSQDIKIIVTSRERLHLVAETILELHGLPVPSSESEQPIDSFSSIQLFLKNAQRISPKLSLKADADAIERICQLVDGLPLGIILASSWVRVYNCSQIADEIKNNIDFLSTSSPDIVPRQHSLKAVFDSSWLLLTEEEQHILRKLSIFQAPFTSLAAQVVCSASPITLAALVDKSLLQHGEDDRYLMLETFHQYTFTKLKMYRAEYIEIQKNFCDFYADLCTRIKYKLVTPDQRQALDEMNAEIENIRIAWNWLVELDRWEVIDRMKQAILTYHIMLGYFIKGREYFRLALSKLSLLNDPALGLIHTSMKQLDAWMSIKAGFITEGLQSLTPCLESFQAYKSWMDIGMTQMFLAEANSMVSNYQIAIVYIEDAIKTLQESPYPRSNFLVSILANCRSILGNIQVNMGELESGRENLKSSLATHLRIGTAFGSIHPLRGLARLATLQGNFIEAQNLYQQALETATHVYDQRGMVVIHNNLSAVYEGQANISESYHHVLLSLQLCHATGDRRMRAIILNNLAYHQLKYLIHPSEAIRTYQESMEVFTELGDLRGLAYTSYDISKAYIQAGLAEEAWNYCLQALHISLTIDNIAVVLHALHGFANLYANYNQPEMAYRYCHLIINHPQTDEDTRNRAIVTKVELESRLPLDFARDVSQWAESVSLEDVIDQILAIRKSQRLPFSTPIS